MFSGNLRNAGVQALQPSDPEIDISPCAKQEQHVDIGDLFEAGETTTPRHGDGVPALLALMLRRRRLTPRCRQ